MSDSDGKDDALYPASFASLKPEQEALVVATYRVHHLCLELGHHSFAECNTVGRKRLQPNGKPQVLVRNPALSAERLQRESPSWIEDIRRKTVRFQAHPFGHVQDPSIHRRTKDAERNRPAP